MSPLDTLPAATDSVSPHLNTLLSEPLPDMHMEVTHYLASRGARLLRHKGRLLLQLQGTVRVDGQPITFDLLPDEQVLVKLETWKRLSPAKRLTLVQERVTDEWVSRVHQQVQEFVEAVSPRARLLKNPGNLWSALTVQGEFASARFAVIEARIADRMAHENQQLIAEKTKATVSLATYPETFEVASQMRRKFIAVLGPTNSGKTHLAMEHLASARCGAYLAPLRLLALENYERLQEKGVRVSLVTGEEQRLDPTGTHVASTVEMANFTRRLDVAVIDEVQLLADPERGGAWVAAICGIPADIVYLVGAPAARPALEALANRLNVELEVRMLERKSPLHVLDTPISSLKDLKPGDALIAFSRRNVLEWAENASRCGLSVATIYGNLSPETRRAQAARFREGEAQVLVATDAVGMGLNLPVARIIFTTAMKYDGYDEDLLPAPLAQQIAGRAGRFGMHEEGHVSATNQESLRSIRELLGERVPALASTGFRVIPSLDHLSRISGATGETRLARLLDLFARHTNLHDEFFVPANLEEQADRAKWLDQLKLSLEDKFILSLVPISMRVTSLMQAWEQWAQALASGKVSRLKLERLVPGPKALQEAEDACKRYSAYAWLAYRRPDFFPDAEMAVQASRTASGTVNTLLLAQTRARAPASRRPGAPAVRKLGAPAARRR